jgi:hypothetical protein
VYALFPLDLVFTIRTSVLSMSDVFREKSFRAQFGGIARLFSA